MGTCSQPTSDKGRLHVSQPSMISILLRESMEKERGRKGGKERGKVGGREGEGEGGRSERVRKILTSLVSENETSGLCSDQHPINLAIKA